MCVPHVEYEVYFAKYILYPTAWSSPIEAAGPSGDPDCIEHGRGPRLRAEIKTTANLQHPHILPLHDSGEAVGLLFFGIALAISAGGGDRLTETGLSLGTPHYMSPEQATGDQSVGPAADIYALGCVLYEMLVGEPPFTGGTPQAVLAKILTEDRPSPTAARPLVPDNVDAVVSRALEKVPADRFATAADFVMGLTDATFRHGLSKAEPALSNPGVWKPLAVALAATSVILAAVLLAEPGSTPASEAVRRFAVPFEPGTEPRAIDDEQFAVATDGTFVVYGAPDQRLWHRSVGELRGSPIPGTDRAVHREVYVRPFPDTRRAQVQVSLNGGREPLWAHNGRELFFVDLPRRRIVAAEFEGPPGFRLVSRRALPPLPDDIDMLPYAVSPNDARFLMLRRVEQRSVSLLVVDNWTREIEARLPPP